MSGAPMSAAQRGVFELALRMGDSDLILAQRLAAWLGHGPIIEEDMASANISLDLLGQARLWYALAVAVEGAGRSEDDLAFLRDSAQWRNLLIVEQPNGNYGDTIARQFLFDCWHRHVLTGLAQSSDARVAEIAAKGVKEVAYHVRRSADLVVRLGDGTAHSHALMQAAFERLWPFTGEMFDQDSLDAELVAGGISPSPAASLDLWRRDVAEVLARATLAEPASGWMQKGGRVGRHTEHLGHLLAEMQFLQRAYPGMKW